MHVQSHDMLLPNLSRFNVRIYCIILLKRNSLHPTGFSSLASPLCMIFNSHKYRSPLTTCNSNKILILKDMGQITESKWDVMQFDDVIGKNKGPDMRTSRYMPNLILVMGCLSPLSSTLTSLVSRNIDRMSV